MSEDVKEKTLSGNSGNLYQHKHQHSHCFQPSGRFQGEMRHVGCRGVEGGDASEEYVKKKQVWLISDASPHPFSSRLFWFGLVAAINAPPCWNRSAI